MMYFLIHILIIQLFPFVSAQLVAQISQLRQDAITYPHISAISQQYIQNKFPIKSQSNCLRNALKPFLEICMVHGVESVETELRVKTAIQLSVCEFEASGLTSYPPECSGILHDDSGGSSGTGIDVVQCVAELESSPQWWTTYSGNYQNLPQICMENSLPFEKEQLLDLFLNITDMYAQFQSDVMKQWLLFSSNLEHESKNNLNNIHNMFDSFIDHLREAANQNEREMEQERKNFSASMSSDMSQLRSQILQTFKDLESNYMEQYQEKTEQSILDLDSVLSNLVRVTKEKHDIVHDELNQAQEESFHLVYQFNRLMHETVIPLLTEDLLPTVNEISSSITNNLENANEEVSRKLDGWSRSLDDRFAQIDKSAAQSLERAEQMEASMEKLDSLLDKSLRGLRSVFSVMNFVMKRQILFICAIQMVFRKYITLKMYLCAISVFATALMGSRAGTMASIIFQSTRPPKWLQQ